MLWNGGFLQAAGFYLEAHGNLRNDAGADVANQFQGYTQTVQIYHDEGTRPINNGCGLGARNPG